MTIIQSHLEEALASIQRSCEERKDSRTDCRYRASADGIISSRKGELYRLREKRKAGLMRSAAAHTPAAE
jgi:hypothetical protein